MSPLYFPTQVCLSLPFPLFLRSSSTLGNQKGFQSQDLLRVALQDIMPPLSSA